MTAPTVIQWVLDTRDLWPEAKATLDLIRVARRAMALLSADERAAVLRFYFVRDAKLSLGSALLKRLAIARFCRVPWPAATPSRDPRTGKPVFLLHPSSSAAAAAEQQPLLFNISHQAGVVVLFAAHRPPPGLLLGTDVVCPAERRSRDRDAVAAEGWPRYVVTHDEVLCPREVARLCALPSTDLATRLDYFYTLWCLREAYVKMTGEALLAPWLHDLEIRYFAPPGTTPPEGADKALEVWLHGERVQDVDVKLRRVLGGEYMISTVVKRGTDGEGLEVGDFELLDLDEVLQSAEELSRRGGQ